MPGEDVAQRAVAEDARHEIRRRPLREERHRQIEEVLDERRGDLLVERALHADEEPPAQERVRGVEGHEGRAARRDEREPVEARAPEDVVDGDGGGDGEG